MQPRNRKEAEKFEYAYGAYNPDKCAHPTRWGEQCFRSPGHGTDGIFCKQHAKMMKANED